MGTAARELLAERGQKYEVVDTKQAMSGVVSELTQGGLLEKHEGPTATYSVAKPKALRNLLSPLPHRPGDWAERFALAAHLLTAWRRYGKRATYMVEVVRILDEQRSLVRSVQAHFNIDEPD